MSSPPKLGKSPAGSSSNLPGGDSGDQPAPVARAHSDGDLGRHAAAASAASAFRTQSSTAGVAGARPSREPPQYDQAMRGRGHRLEDPRGSAVDHREHDDHRRRSASASGSPIPRRASSEPAPPRDPPLGAIGGQHSARAGASASPAPSLHSGDVAAQHAAGVSVPRHGTGQRVQLAFSETSRELHLREVDLRDADSSAKVDDVCRRVAQRSAFNPIFDLEAAILFCNIFQGTRADCNDSVRAFMMVLLDYVQGGAVPGKMTLTNLTETQKKLVDRLTSAIQDERAAALRASTTDAVAHAQGASAANGAADQLAQLKSDGFRKRMAALMSPGACVVGIPNYGSRIILDVMATLYRQVTDVATSESGDRRALADDPFVPASLGAGRHGHVAGATRNVPLSRKKLRHFKEVLAGAFHPFFDGTRDVVDTSAEGALGAYSARRARKGHSHADDAKYGFVHALPVVATILNRAEEMGERSANPQRDGALALALVQQCMQQDPHWGEAVGIFRVSGNESRVKATAHDLRERGLDPRRTFDTPGDVYSIVKEFVGDRFSLTVAQVDEVSALLDEALSPAADLAALKRLRALLPKNEIELFDGLLAVIARIVRAQEGVEASKRLTPDSFATAWGRFICETGTRELPRQPQAPEVGASAEAFAAHTQAIKDWAALAKKGSTNSKNAVMAAMIRAAMAGSLDRLRSDEAADIAAAKSARATSEVRMLIAMGDRNPAFMAQSPEDIALCMALLARPQTPPGASFVRPSGNNPNVFVFTYVSPSDRRITPVYFTQAENGMVQICTDDAGTASGIAFRSIEALRSHALHGELLTMFARVEARNAAVVRHPAFVAAKGGHSSAVDDAVDKLLDEGRVGQYVIYRVPGTADFYRLALKWQVGQAEPVIERSFSVDPRHTPGSGYVVNRYPEESVYAAGLPEVLEAIVAELHETNRLPAGVVPSPFSGLADAHDTPRGRALHVVRKDPTYVDKAHARDADTRRAAFQEKWQHRYNGFFVRDSMHSPDGVFVMEYQVRDDTAPNGIKMREARFVVADDGRYTLADATGKPFAGENYRSRTLDGFVKKMRQGVQEGDLRSPREKELASLRAQRHADVIARYVSLAPFDQDLGERRLLTSDPEHIRRHGFNEEAGVAQEASDNAGSFTVCIDPKDPTGFVYAYRRKGIELGEDQDLSKLVGHVRFAIDSEGHFALRERGTGRLIPTGISDLAVFEKKVAEMLMRQGLIASVTAWQPREIESHV